MPQAIPLIFSILASQATTVFMTVVWMVLAAAASYLIARQTASDDPSPIDTPTRGQQINTQDTRTTVKLIYGETIVGINRVFVESSGGENQHLHVIGEIGEGEIEGIVEIDGVPQIFLDGKIYTEYGAKFTYEFFNGSATQNKCATLYAIFQDWKQNKRYCAYLYMKFNFDIKLYQGLPEVTVRVQGLKVYDPVSGLTAYSNNPALCARDFLTRSSRRGGMGYASTRIDDDSIIDAAAYCTAKSWTCNIAIMDAQAASDNFPHILNTFRGALIYSNPYFKLRYKDLNYESSVMAITEDDVIEAGGVSTLRVVQPDVFDTPNSVNCKFTNEEKHFQIDSYILPDPAAIAADGDYREKEVSLIGVTSLENVQKMANYFLERFRINKTAAFAMGSRGMALEPMDLITLTHSRPGWTDKKLRVLEPRLSQDGEVAISAEEEENALYDDIFNLATHTWRDTNLPDPSATVASVINVVQYEEVYNYRDRSFTRWKIDFDPPAEATYPFWDHADIYLKIGVAGDWKFMTKSGGDYQFDPVEEGETYYCCIVSVSVFGTKQEFADGTYVSKVIEGKLTIPADLASVTALAHGSDISIFSTPLSDPDVAGYEVRLGAWDGGLFIGFNETPNLRLVGVRPGTHNFWMNAKDNSGNYADNAVETTVIVYYPAGYTDKNSWAWDFDAIGTFTNTEYVLNSGIDSLKCSHTGGVLTGKWLSPEYDMGSIKTVRVWGDFITVFINGGSTWDSLFPDPDTWAARLTATTKWNDLLNPGSTGSISAKLLWGDTTGNLTNSVEKLEILAPEISGKFIQVEITIIDPDVGSNLFLNVLNMKAAYWV